ncbi:hypothetical protein AB3X94_37450 [Paraburkholderia sp. BR10923]|uniref:hypothetical protein n=1 Tax=Paraburkholderia sp. BR10923 TaxID=3236992 RepID=UPI0034CE9010
MVAAAGTPVRTISGNREIRRYQNYWYICLTRDELNEYPGVHWHGWVLIHKYKFWKRWGEWYGEDVARYYYLDRDPDNIRITNIGIREIGTDNWVYG